MLPLFECLSKDRMEESMSHCRNGCTTVCTAEECDSSIRLKQAGFGLSRRTKLRAGGVWPMVADDSLFRHPTAFSAKAT